MSYIGNAPVVQAMRVTTELVATAGQTDIYPLGGYTPGDYLDVEINGAALKSNDYTATDGIKIVLAVALSAGDDVRVKAYGNFTIANSVQKTGDTMTGGLNVQGVIGVKTSTPASDGGITLGRMDTGSEGGQLNLCRASDNTSAWAIDVYGNTSTPSLRIVDNIAASTRLQIDGGGRVTTPYQPAFYARQNAGASTTSSVVLLFQDEHFDVGSNFNTSNGRFTAPVAGIYQFGTSASRAYTDGTTDWGVYMRVNGTNRVHIAQTKTSGLYDRVSGTVLMQLAANDYVDVILWAGSGTANLNENFSSSYFTGRLVS